MELVKSIRHRLKVVRWLSGLLWTLLVCYGTLGVITRMVLQLVVRILASNRLVILGGLVLQFGWLCIVLRRYISGAVDALLVSRILGPGPASSIILVVVLVLWRTWVAVSRLWQDYGRLVGRCLVRSWFRLVIILIGRLRDASYLCRHLIRAAPLSDLGLIIVTWMGLGN